MELILHVLPGAEQIDMRSGHLRLFSACMNPNQRHSHPSLVDLRHAEKVGRFDNRKNGHRAPLVTICERPSMSWDKAKIVQHPFVCYRRFMSDMDKTGRLVCSYGHTEPVQGRGESSRRGT